MVFDIHIIYRKICNKYEFVRATFSTFGLTFVFISLLQLPLRNPKCRQGFVAFSHFYTLTVCCYRVHTIVVFT